MIDRSVLPEWDEHYSPEHKMVWKLSKSPGYHTRIADGQRVHETRQAMDYALLLLETGEADRVSRAHEVIAKVLSLQNTDPTHAHYGIWSWFLEEPLDKMDPPDWNWADFIGARLAQTVVDHASKLPTELLAGVRAALGHAAWSIFRRNVQSGYTNIAIMGAGVTMAAGELLAEPRLLDYGRRRLNNMVEFIARNGEFREYNSPTYTIVAVEELERILRLVTDASARADAEHLRCAAWRMIAEHFHPGTGQWAGPHSRAYSDLMSAGTRRFIQARLPASVGLDDRGPMADVPPCPTELVGRFRRLPETPQVITRRFIRREPPDADTIGSTWFTDDACLGSVNRDTLWDQRRVMIGYWRLPDGEVAVIRLRLLKDGRDFAPGFVEQAQDGPRVLSGVYLRQGAGDFHPIFGTPPDLLYPLEDLRIRYELSATGAQVEAIGGGRYSLIAGQRRAVVHTLRGWINDSPVRFETGAAEGRAYVDGVLYSGERKPLDLKTAALHFAAGLELIGVDQPPLAQPPLMQRGGDPIEVGWPAADLRISVPSRSVAFTW